MTESIILLFGGGFALLGGWAIARWGRCFWTPHACPNLLPDQRVQITVESTSYTTVLKSAKEGILLLLAPLHRGLPLSFPPDTAGSLEVAQPSGVYKAPIRLTGRGVYREPSAEGEERAYSVLYAQVQGRWHHTQRRQSSRVLLAEEVSIEVKTDTDSLIGWVKDISAGGMYLFVPTPIASGTELTLDIPPSLRAKGVLHVSCRAKVLACERALRRWGYLYGLRVAFLAP